jgi:hypothetical protein
MGVDIRWMRSLRRFSCDSQFFLDDMTNLNLRVPEEAKVLAWIAITWLAMRAFGACVFVFLEANVNVWRMVAVQVQCRGAGAPLAGGCRDARARSGNEAGTPGVKRNGKCVPTFSM